jgi:hypothetical protein
MRPSSVALALVLLSAGALRFWHLDAGIPYAVGVDEPEVLHRAVDMMKTGNFNPGFFDYPTLYIYVQLAVASLRFLTGAMGGLWNSLGQVSPADFYLWGRATTALAGTLTILLVHQIGLRWGARHGLLAAGLMAVMPLHVRESHYVLTDVPVTFFVALTMLLALRAHESAVISAFAWAGAAAGLAAATKYNGGLVLVLPLLAAWMTTAARPSRLRCALAAAGGAGAAFLLAAPYTLLDLPAFLDGFARLAGSYRVERGAEPGWLIYAKHLRNSLGWPTLLLTCSGLVLGVIRAIKGPGRVRWTLTVAFPLLYFWVIAGQTLVFGRYLLPLLPFVALTAAIAVVSGVSLLRRFDIPRPIRTALIAGLTVAAILPPAIQSIQFNRRIGRESTQALAYQWITRSIPLHSRIAIETYGLRLPPTTYQTRHFSTLTEWDVDRFLESDFHFFVASSQAYGPAFDAPEQRPDQYAAYRRLFDQADEVALFSPSPAHPGPELRIFRLTAADRGTAPGPVSNGR